MHTSHAGFVSSDSYELEADQFAAGLLMPSGPFKHALGRHDAGLGAIESVAGLCKTSLTATAIRYAELTDAAVAIVISTGSTIDFCFMSDAIKSLPQLSWLRKGTPVPQGTATAKLNADPRRVADGDRDEDDIDVTDWLGGSRSARAVEQVVGLGNYGKTLTVITCASVKDETYGGDNDEDEEDLARRWTPRFHR